MNPSTFVDFSASSVPVPAAQGNLFGAPEYQTATDPYMSIFNKHNPVAPIQDYDYTTGTDGVPPGPATWSEPKYMDSYEADAYSSRKGDEDETHTMDSDDYDRSEYDSSSDGDRLSQTASTVVVEGPSLWTDLTDYRLILGASCCLFLVAVLYFYWASICCVVPKNEQMLLTTQYALDKKSYTMMEDNIVF